MKLFGKSKKSQVRKCRQEMEHALPSELFRPARKLLLVIFDNVCCIDSNLFVF